MYGLPAMYWSHSGWVRLRSACVQTRRTQASIALGQSPSVTPAEAIVLPSGLNATPLTSPVWAVRDGPMGLPVEASHSRTVWSALAEASLLASGLSATPRTGPVWPIRGPPIGLPLEVSHRRTVPSSPAEAILLASGLKATPLTGPVWPRQGLTDRFAGGGVPQAYRLVRPGGGNRLPIRAEGHAVGGAGVAGQ